MIPPFPPAPPSSPVPIAKVKPDLFSYVGAVYCGGAGPVRPHLLVHYHPRYGASIVELDDSLWRPAPGGAQRTLPMETLLGHYSRKRPLGPSWERGCPVCRGLGCAECCPSATYWLPYLRENLLPDLCGRYGVSPGRAELLAEGRTLAQWGRALTEGQERIRTPESLTPSAL